MNSTHTDRVTGGYLRVAIPGGQVRPTSGRRCLTCTAAHSLSPAMIGTNTRRMQHNQPPHTHTHTKHAITQRSTHRRPVPSACSTWLLSWTRGLGLVSARGARYARSCLGLYLPSRAVRCRAAVRTLRRPPNDCRAAPSPRRASHPRRAPPPLPWPARTAAHRRAPYLACDWRRGGGARLSLVGPPAPVRPHLFPFACVLAR